MRRTLAFGLGGSGALVGAALWWRTHPSACPYNQRFWIEAPHPLITRRRLLEALAPEQGETVLEVGPGTGYYTLPVARSLLPGGTLHILDLQPKMVDHTLTLARRHEIDNIEGRAGDAQRLPYADKSFDAAFLVTTLGEIPDQRQALRELRRVTRPNGRLVVGELAGDPHMVTSGALQERAAAAGWHWVRRIGPRIGYFGVLRAAG